MTKTADTRLRVLRMARMLSTSLIGVILLCINYASAGVYYVQLNAPSQTNVGSNFTVTLTTNVVKDSAATGYVSGKIIYSVNQLKLINIYAVDYPEVTAGGANGIITVTSPSKGAGNGYDGRLTIFRATFAAIATGTAQLVASGGAMYVNGTNHTVISDSVTVYAQSCPSGQTGTPPNCVSPTPVSVPSPTPTATPQPSATSAPTSSPVASTNATSSNSTKAPTPSPKSTTVHTNNPQSTTTTTSVTGSGQPKNITATGSVTITPESYMATASTIHLQLRASDAMYDVSASYGIAAESLTTPLTPSFSDGHIVLDAQGLTPSTTYYFGLAAKDSSDKDVRYTIAYATDGYPVKIIVTSSGQPVADTDILVGEATFKTSADGIVALNLIPGTYVLSNPQASVTETIEVVRSPKPEFGEYISQDFIFDVPAMQNTAQTKRTSSSIGIIGMVGLLFLFFGTVAFIWYIRRRRQVQNYDVVPIDGVYNPFDSGNASTEDDSFAVYEQQMDEYYRRDSMAKDSAVLPRNTAVDEMPILPQPTDIRPPSNNEIIAP